MRTVFLFLFLLSERFAVRTGFLSLFFAVRTVFLLFFCCQNGLLSELVFFLFFAVRTVLLLFFCCQNGLLSELVFFLFFFAVRTVFLFLLSERFAVRTGFLSLFLLSERFASDFTMSSSSELSESTCLQIPRSDSRCKRPMMEMFCRNIRNIEIFLVNYDFLAIMEIFCQ